MFDCLFVDSKELIVCILSLRLI